MRRWRLAVALTLLTSRVGAEVPLRLVKPEDVKLYPPLAELPQGEDQIVALRLREPAPFEGQLFSTDTAIRWGFWLEQWHQRYKLDIAYERNRCATSLQYQQRLLDASRDRASVIERDLNVRLLRSEAGRVKAEEHLYRPGFFDSPGFYYALGVATTAGLVGLSIWAVDAAR